jgi:alkylhydroperoxidase/carboxymuconolactone decarboxylase family protein YurZ
MATESGQAKASVNQQPESLWAAALNQRKKWHPAWPEHTVKMTTNPWMNGILPIKFVELVSVGSNTSRTNLKPEGTRRHYTWPCVPRCTPKNVLPPKELELLLVAFDAAYVHTYGPGTRGHIKNAFKAGATVEEIMKVLKLGVVQGVQACNLGVTLLTEELERDAAA